MATQYKAEYAKSGRSSCKKCGQSIPDGALRIGPLVQSPHFDGKVPLWHHFDCLAAKAAALVDPAQIDGYFSLRPEHLAQIDSLIASNRSPTSAARADDKKTSKSLDNLSETPGEINVEAAKSGRSSCRKCFQNIAQGALRIGRMGCTERNGQQFPATQWMHSACFFSVDCAELSQLNGASALPAALKKELDVFLKKAGKAAAGQSLYVALPQY
jgi:poly [ADP-ribose] polymerase